MEAERERFMKGGNTIDSAASIADSPENNNPFHVTASPDAVPLGDSTFSFNNADTSNAHLVASSFLRSQCDGDRFMMGKWQNRRVTSRQNDCAKGSFPSAAVQ